MRNPFRSEADAFRLLVLIGGGVLVIIVAGLLGGAAAGIPVALVLAAFAARATYRWIRLGLAPPDDPAAAQPPADPDDFRHADPPARD